MRWFTPAIEVELCGHATLASAHVLWESGMIGDTGTAGFHTLSGALPARKFDDWIELDFPAIRQKPIDPPDGLADAIGATPLHIGESRHDYLIEVDSENTVRTLAPNISQLRNLNIRGVIVTSRAATAEYDFVSRFFAPGAGIDEDPVTGSAHCCLGPYWQEKLGKSEMVAYQASKRGGTVRVRVGTDRVYLRGQAVTTMIGELTV
jgi:PhzF family phenazine biosynthesis protein